MWRIRQWSHKEHYLPFLPSLPMCSWSWTTFIFLIAPTFACTKNMVVFMCLGISSRLLGHCFRFVLGLIYEYQFSLFIFNQSKLILILRGEGWPKNFLKKPYQSHKVFQPLQFSYIYLRRILQPKHKDDHLSCTCWSAELKVETKRQVK